MSNYPNPQITKTQLVNATADQTWELLAQFDKLANFAPSFLESSEVDSEIGEGTTRTCVAPNNQGYFKEKITYFNETERLYKYSMVESMLPVEGMQNSMRVVELGESCSLIIWTSAFNFINNPNMPREQFDGFIEASLNEYLGNIAKEAESTVLA